MHRQPVHSGLFGQNRCACSDCGVMRFGVRGQGVRPGASSRPNCPALYLNSWFCGANLSQPSGLKLYRLRHKRETHTGNMACQPQLEPEGSEVSLRGIKHRHLCGSRLTGTRVVQVRAMNLKGPPWGARKPTQAQATRSSGSSSQGNICLELASANGFALQPDDSTSSSHTPGQQLFEGA